MKLEQAIAKLKSARSLLDGAADDLMSVDSEKGHDVKQLVFACDLQLLNITRPGTSAPIIHSID